MDAVLALKGRRAFSAADVERVRVSAPRAHLDNLMYEDPRNALQAKFSLEFALALLLVEGECRLSHFAEAAVARPDIRALYPRIVREPRDGPPGDITHHVELTLGDGETLTASVTHAIGSRAAPFSWDGHWEKLDACVGDLLGPAAMTEFRDLLERLPALPSVAPLMRALSRASA
jgi:2-methylcitrate dehydratase PrpD